MKCEFCGLDPYEYVDIGIGMQAIAVNCCHAGYLLYDKGVPYEEAKAAAEWEREQERLFIEYQEKVARGEIQPPQEEEDIPF